MAFNLLAIATWA